MQGLHMCMAYTYAGPTHMQGLHIFRAYTYAGPTHGQNTDIDDHIDVPKGMIHGDYRIF